MIRRSSAIAAAISGDIQKDLLQTSKKAMPSKNLLAIQPNMAKIAAKINILYSLITTIIVIISR